MSRSLRRSIARYQDRRAEALARHPELQQIYEILVMIYRNRKEGNAEGLEKVLGYVDQIVAQFDPELQKKDLSNV